MVQLKVLTGSMAGTAFVAGHFPVRIGRSQGADIQLEEQGVWDEHFQVTMNPEAGYALATFPDALVTVNGQPVKHAALRNGDLLEIGALKIQFWLSEVPQRGLTMREGFVWALIVGTCLAQIALIYWLVQ